jgi:uncharacterized membrane protein
MTFKQGLALYVCVTLVMLPLDVLWLGTVGRTFYKDQLGDILLERPALGAALAFYLLYALGVVLFAIAPAMRDGAWTTALLWGALFGLFAYATYDLSNLATLRGFTTAVALVDMAWGSVLTGLTAAGAFSLARYFSWA